jgi:elongation factor P
MNQETFDQVRLDDEVVGDAMKYLLPETVIEIDFYEDNPVSVELPTTVNLRIVEVEPGMKGATASASYKPAKLETGLVVQVPQFVEAGTVIKVDTRDDAYLERVS